jgi:subtilase family serine protease
LKIDEAGLHAAVQAASQPGSPTYGQYPTLPELAAQFGASERARRAVAHVFRRYGGARLDVTHQRMSATVSLAAAQRIFGTRWALYAVPSALEIVALPVRRPVLPAGLAGNVDIVAGLRLSLPLALAAHKSSVGTPIRTGSVAAGCLDATDPRVVAGQDGLFPNQLLTAYGIAPLQASGLQGQGVRVAIVGEAPPGIGDVRAFRDCFGTAGTPLEIHGGRRVPPILESSLDAMVVSMVAPQLASFDLWVRPLDESQADNDVLGFLQLLAAPVEAAAAGHPLPDVISASYGECESDVAPFTAERRLVERQLAATAALGITVAVASGDMGSSSCASDAPSGERTAAEKRIDASWPATSPYVLAVGGTDLTLDASNAIAASGAWNDDLYAPPFRRLAAGGGGRSTLFASPSWQTTTPWRSAHRTVPDVSAFADPSPGYPVVCSARVEGCPSGRGRRLAFVGGTSASTPLVAGMIALWTQAARERGLPRPGFVPPLLYSLAATNPQAFLDITTGGNSLFGEPCCAAAAGYDLATGLGSPLADQIAALLPG